MTKDWKDLLGALELPAGETDVETTRAAGNVSPVPEKSSKPSVSMFYERKGRAGKPATILADFKGADNQRIEQLASFLRRSLGTGGSCRGGEILLQGDRRLQLRPLLEQQGFTVRN